MFTVNTAKIYQAMLILFLTYHSQAAEIIRVNKNNLSVLPKGKEVDGMIGDWVLRNDRVIAVIGNASPDREANQMVSSIQGAVIDFTTLKANNDQLTVYYPQGARIDIASADTVIVISGAGSTVQLKVVKYATTKEPFIAETVYSLSDGEAALKVRTIYRNTSSKTINVPVYDLLRCDNGLEDVTPTGSGKLAFIYNKWYHSAYGVLTKGQMLYTPSTLLKKNLVAQGHKIYFEGLSEKPEETVVLEPGKEVAVERSLLTGTSVADLQLQAVGSGLDEGLYEIGVLVMDVKKNNLENAYIELRNSGNKMQSSAITNSAGNASVFAKAGSYILSVSRPGHNTVDQKIELKSTPLKQTFVLNPQSSISFDIKDEQGKNVPARLEFKGLKGTKKPMLGPPTRSNGVYNLYYSSIHEFSLPIAPGDYEVSISRGPEYQVETVKVSVIAGRDEKMQVALRRAFHTPNYIIADLHNHTTGSGDSNAGIPDRVINMAGAGIEFAPATEHNRISTFTNVIKELKLQNFIASSTGIELSGRPGPGSTNHQIGFPLRLQPELRGYGAPKTDKDPYVQMKRLYDYDGGKFKLMQQNHPEISQLYFDKNNDGVADKGYGTEEFTDVMEIRESMLDLPEAVNGGDVNTRSFQWLQMLNLGYKILGVANSDGHTVGNASGSVFNYIYTKRDQPSNIDSTDIAMQVKKGHVIMSNGPFMTVGVKNAIPGDHIYIPEGKLVLKVDIKVNNQNRINTVQILVNGKVSDSLTFSKDKNPALFMSQPEIFNLQIPIALKNDAHLIVMAYSRSDVETNKKKGPPMALSNPIFVDVDGNGFTPNKDMMGYGLPAPKSDKISSSEQ